MSYLIAAHQAQNNFVVVVTGSNKVYSSYNVQYQYFLIAFYIDLSAYYFTHLIKMLIYLHAASESAASLPHISQSYYNVINVNQ